MDTKRIFTALLSTSLLFTTAFSQGHQVLEKQYSIEEPITKLTVNGAFSVEFIDGDKSSITVIGDPDIVPKVKVESMVSQDNGSSSVTVSSYSEESKGKSKLIVEGKEGYLKQIELSGATSFETKNPMKVETLMVSAKGASSVVINGTFQTVIIESKGASVVYLSGTTDFVAVEAFGVSEVDISKLTYQTVKMEAYGVAHILTKEKNADHKVTRSEHPSPYINDRKNDDSTTSQTIIENYTILKTIEGNDSTEINIIENKFVIKNADKKREPIVAGPWKIYLERPNKKIEGFTKYSKPKFDGHWAGIELAINGYNTSDFNTDYPDGYEYLDLYYPKSIAFYLNLLEYNLAFSKNQKWGMLTGLGFEWHNYRFSNAVWLDTQGGELQGYNIVGAPVKKSKLTMSYMTVPLIIEFQTNNKCRANSFHIGLGVVGGLRTGSHTKVKFENKNAHFETPFNEYTSSSKKIKKHDDFYLKPVKLEATTRIGWGWINLFATYSLTPMFRENRAPELYPWAVGITLLGW